MAVLANPRLIGELEKYGAEHVVKCYHCGNCSATCPFSREPFLFPRKSMRYLQMGLEEKLKGTLEPWLCYYCGECSEQCPREEEPGETMMSMRRAHQPVRFHRHLRLFYQSWVASAGRAAGGRADRAGLLALRHPAAISTSTTDRAPSPSVVHPSTGAWPACWCAVGHQLRACGGSPWVAKAGFGAAGAYLRHLLLLPQHFITQRTASATRPGPAPGPDAQLA